MTAAELADIYRDYIACLNAQDWQTLGQFVADDVQHNGRRLGLSGYRAMLEQDFREIPDLRFSIELLVSDPPHVASRLAFDCAPKGKFLGLDVNGKRVAFRKRVLRVPRPQDRAGLVGHRQDRDRGPTPAPLI